MTPAARGGDGPRPAGLLLILAASIYDGLLCLAILFIASAAAVAVNGGEAIPPGTIVFEAWLVTVLFPYFAWCWIQGGHTLGMRSWRLVLARPDGGPVTLRNALVRYVGACLSLAAFGLGFVWMLVDREHKSWHDRMSGTRVYRRR